MEGGGVFLHGGIAVDVGFEPHVVGGLDRDQLGIGGKRHRHALVVADVHPFVVHGLLAIDAHQIIGGFDRQAGFSVQQADMNRVFRLRVQACAENSCTQQPDNLHDFRITSWPARVFAPSRQPVYHPTREHLSVGRK